MNKAFVHYTPAFPSGRAADAMKIEILFVFGALVVLTSSSQTIGQNSHLPPISTPVAFSSQAGTPAASISPLDARDGVSQLVHNPVSQSSAGRAGTPNKTTTVTEANGKDPVYRNDVVTMTSRVATSQHTSVHAATPADPTQSAVSLSAALDSSLSPSTRESSTPVRHISTPGGTTLLAEDPHITSAPPSTPSTQGTTPTQPSTQPRVEAVTPALTQLPTSHSQTSAPAHAPAGPTHQEVPSELNVGDEVFKGPHHHRSSPLDPLLAGLVSVFIVTTAIISVVLFLKFRQRTNHPEFHRLQDLPMDDLMEDTPLSRYTY
ncbi:uncharacterized protein ACJ7VT_017162 [Polymixia lowei]